MSYSTGSLVKARGREWVVLPESEDDLLVLRPLGGTDDEITGIFLQLEKVEPASFTLPDATEPGDYLSCRLLRDALRLGFRSSAGPFRSFARLGVEPRPYQLVPLLMALKLDPVRLLIADDVGIGKTIEAGLIAREMLDRGEITRLAVLCPPHLAEQWQKELEVKFNISAELVLPGTAARLERHLGVGESLFEYYPFVIVSMDYIKTDRHRDEFIRACPEMVIVDEAHTCAFSESERSTKHQRYRLIKNLAENPNRHMIFVTATPHSGKEETFRSLLAFLNQDFSNLPADLSGEHNKEYRRKLAEQLVQRRRADIRHYMKTDTPFPVREDKEETYLLGNGSDYMHLFNRVLAYARETVRETDGSHFRQRVRWWSALALLRSLASSPAAAAETLRNRAAASTAESPEEADEVGRRTVLDIDIEDSGEDFDLSPGADPDEDTNDNGRLRRRLLEMAKLADALKGKKDTKLQKAIPLIKDFLNNGHNPIIFCRFIPTAEYVAESLRAALPSTVEVVSVTGTLPPAEREERVFSMAASEKRVLVCTDCLSEGVNLQDHFDAVMHYDLSWNPTRHEQREGRVDRYGQPKDKVRVLTYYGTDNKIDGIVLDVLLRKHKTIRNDLGISVPIPVDTNKIVDAIFEGILLRQTPAQEAQMLIPGFETEKLDLFEKWENATTREKRSRTIFAQESIKIDEVAREFDSVRSSMGSSTDVSRFVQEAFKLHNAVVSQKGTAFKFDLKEVSKPLKDVLGDISQTFDARFELPVPDKTVYLNRTHPIVESLASYILNTALDPLLKGVARRCGAIITSKVQTRTTLLLLRYRYYIIATKEGKDIQLLAEDCQTAGFTGSPESATWLDSSKVEELLDAQPEANISPDRASSFILRVIDGYGLIRPKLEELALSRGEELLDAHRRVRTAAQMKGIRYRVEPHLPPDVLGAYVFLPVQQGGA